MIFPGPGDIARRQDGARRPSVEGPEWEAQAGAAPFTPHPGPRVRLRQAAHPELGQSGRPSSPAGTRVPMLRAVRLPGQVSAFSQQLVDRWALECCSQAPWPRSTWRFTHPFLNLILCHFIPLPTQCLLKSLLPTTLKHGTRTPWAAWGMSPQLGEPPEHRTQVATLETAAPGHPLQGEGPWGWPMSSRTRKPSGHV